MSLSDIYLFCSNNIHTMTANIARKRKLSKEEKGWIKAILGKITKTDFATRGGISWSTLVEATVQFIATPYTIKKIHKVYQELENINKQNQ